MTRQAFRSGLLWVGRVWGRGEPWWAYKVYDYCVVLTSPLAVSMCVLLGYGDRSRRAAGPTEPWALSKASGHASYHARSRLRRARRDAIVLKFGLGTPASQRPRGGPIYPTDRLAPAGMDLGQRR